MFCRVRTADGHTHKLFLYHRWPVRTARPYARRDHAVEPLITGLKARGFCFRTLREHPQYQGWIAQHGG